MSAGNQHSFRQESPYHPQNSSATMSKLYINISNAPVRFLVKEGGVESFRDVNIGDYIIVDGETIGFTTIGFTTTHATTETKFSDVEKYFKRYHSPDEYKEMNEFKKHAAIAAMQALIRRQDDTAEHISQMSMQYAESLTNKMFE